MPEDNRVVGVQDFPKEIYKSVSLSFSTKIANTLPLFIDYAYGIDALRKTSPTGSVSNGCHEVRAFVVAAFGEIK